MIQSMTGFSNTNCELENLHITIELRAVNHRYLDIQIRQPEELRPLENQLREKIQNKIQRGKIECRINIQLLSGQSTSLILNPYLLDNLLKLNQDILAKDNTLTPLSVAEILKFPQIIQQDEIQPEIFQKTILTLLDKTLEDFCATRLREGEKLAAHLSQRLQAMSEIVANVEQHIPTALDAYHEKLQARLKEALAEIHDERIKQEFVLFMQKSDVDEELSRLKTHITEVTRILTQKGSVGKRLDFLMQEMNREANTLGSKSISSETTQASVELKVLIEQMREQIQNIE